MSNFSVLLMMDGILILTGTLFVMWTIPFFYQDAYNAPISYFSIYYFVFASLVKTIARKKYILNMLMIGLLFLFVLLVASVLPLPANFQPYTFILAGLDVMVLIGTLLYYFLNRMLSDLGLQNPNIMKRN